MRLLALRQVPASGECVCTLPHDVATVLGSSGNRPELTSKMLGHASVGFTLSVYTYPDDDEMDQVGALLGRAIGSKS
jgi:hypothetical protein